MPSEPNIPKKKQSLKEYKQAAFEAATAKHYAWLLNSGLSIPELSDEEPGQPVTQASPCNTGMSVDIQPRKRDTSLPSIPPTPIGSIDTIGAMVQVPPAKKDVEQLRKLQGFVVTTREAGSVKHPDGQEKKLKAKLSFRRESDDLRVWIYDDGIRIEVSIPRVLGLTNDKQGRVTEAQAVEAFESVTSKLFPLTTAQAQRAGPTFGWRVTRLDLAKNFKAKLPEVIEDSRFIRHPDIRADAETHGQNGISMYGENYELCLYGLREKMGRSVVRKAQKGKTFEMDDANLIRFEFRFRSAVALDRMSKELPIDQRGLPFLVTCEDGARRIFRLGIENHLLQQILAREARKLGSLTSRQVEGAEKWKPVYRLGVMYLAEQPWAWSLVKGNYGERRIRELKQAVASIRVSMRKTDFVRLIWNAPLISASLRARLVEQLSSMSPETATG
ncbi:MAG: hypothetical protein JNK02_15875 [Planctomycetes bacterium]|nr:hypothetical protein [Planctomycetota bacterium]